MPLAIARVACLLGLLLFVCPPRGADAQSPRSTGRAAVKDSNGLPAAPAAAARLVQAGGPNGAPGGDPQTGLRVGTPYYWSGSSPYTGYSPGGYGAAGPYGETLPAEYGYGSYGNGGYGGYGIPGGYSARTGDPYMEHFGPGYYRQGDYGHFRFPFYSYRRPWYFPGQPSYNRDTNFPW